MVKHKEVQFQKDKPSILIKFTLWVFVLVSVIAASEDEVGSSDRGKCDERDEHGAKVHRQQVGDKENEANDFHEKNTKENIRQLHLQSGPDFCCFLSLLGLSVGSLFFLFGYPRGRFNRIKKGSEQINAIESRPGSPALGCGCKYGGKST